MSKSDLEKNQRTIFIGDIHGCYDEFIALLEKVKYDVNSDRLISLGDLVHKGPKSAQVIDYMIQNNVDVIMGNHDWRFYQGLKEESEKYDEAEKIISHSSYSKAEILQWFESLPYYIEGHDFIAVHGCLNPAEKKFYKTNPKKMMFGRYYDLNSQTISSKTKDDKNSDCVPWYKAYPRENLKGKFIVFGHWAKKESICYKNFRGLDTGCCYGGKLSALILPEDKIVQISSKQKKQFDY
ncbi:MAG: metallophosphoesterase [Lentisphaeraceae bacterium]|nr:metallophosphoesterase [Lentisphaeraceae bacterium]